MISADSLSIDFPACIAAEYPQEFPLAWSAVERTLAAARGGNFGALERRSPGLKGFDWNAYLRCSVARMVRALRALREHGLTTGRVLDYGAYFGNFSLMLASCGYTVEAIDSYAAYAPALDSVRDLLGHAGVTVLDFDEASADLGSLAGRYDAVFCMGVIEHVPHTPRAVLDAIGRVLRRGGALVLDTPNLGYLYTREKLERGESIFTPIELQYYTELPFEGHHREFTVPEVDWMLREAGFANVRIETFNYSQYGLTTLEGETLRKHRLMEKTPELREVISAAGKKP